LASITTSAEAEPVAARGILSVRPNVGREDAISIFGGRDLGAMLWRLRKGGLQAVADVYVPYRFYRVHIAGRRASLTHIYAIDSVDGSLDPYEFETVPAGQSLMQVKTRNCLAASLDQEQAKSLLREKTLRMIFQGGFFKVGTADLRLESLAAEIYLPYWLGFYGRNGRVDFRIIDAVRRCVEGAKAHALFESWIASA